MRPSLVDSTAKILLIDDSVTDLQVLMGMMTHKQYRLTVAFNGQDGYRKASLIHPDLILLDVRMPDMDGYATCRLLKAHEATRNIPVIFLTAANDSSERLEGLSLGAVDYIAKPFVSEEEVMARVSIHLNLARRLGVAPSDELVQTGSASVTATASVSDRALVKAATRYLSDHLSHPPSPMELARLLGTNERKLNEAFHATLSLPVFAWVREERMRQARQFLENTDTPVREIGEYLGYPNPSNFSTAFKERFGFSPREFRVRIRHKNETDDADPP